MASVEIKTPTASEQPIKKRKPGPGRPPAAQAAQIKEARGNRFFDAVNQVPREDWGTRVILWLYRLEPYTDRKKSGDNIYLLQYMEPVDENRVMMDFGSGRYRLMLTSRKQGADRGDELDKHEFEIINQAYPPKIPGKEWVEDPRNIKWAWARPADAPPLNGQPLQPQQQSAVLETLQVLTHIEDRAAERAQANQQPVSDPIDAAVRILNLTKGGGDTVLMEMFRDEMRATRARAEKLEDELRSRNNPAPAAVDPIDALTKAGEGYKKLKDLFGGGESKENGSGGSTARSRMGPWMEFFQPVLPEVAGILKAFATPLAGVMAQRMMQRPQPPGQQQHVTQPPAIQAPAAESNGAQPSAPPPNEQQQDLVNFIERITPPMLNHLSQGYSGEVFASFIADGWGTERVQQMQMAPPEAIMQFYKSTPYWAQLQDRENGFVKFLQEFAAWKPEDDDETPSGGEEEKEEIG